MAQNRNVGPSKMAISHHLMAECKVVKNSIDNFDDTKSFALVSQEVWNDKQYCFDRKINIFKGKCVFYFPCKIDRLFTKYFGWCGAQQIPNKICSNGFVLVLVSHNHYIFIKY